MTMQSKKKRCVESKSETHRSLASIFSLSLSLSLSVSLSFSLPQSLCSYISLLSHIRFVNSMGAHYPPSSLIHSSAGRSFFAAVILCSSSASGSRSLVAIFEKKVRRTTSLLLLSLPTLHLHLLSLFCALLIMYFSVCNQFFYNQIIIYLRII